jgi:hypothetical protein
MQILGWSAGMPRYPVFLPAVLRETEISNIPLVEFFASFALQSAFTMHQAFTGADEFNKHYRSW